MLVIEDVTKRYGERTALTELSLEVGAGEIVGLIGPNGAGKTTLMSVVVGLLRPDAGRVSIAGIDVQREPRRARGLVGFAPQELGIYPGATVAENLAFFGRLSGLRRRTLADGVAETARAVALDHLLGRRAGTLSGGERRRLHVATAMLHRPPLVLLDEPTAGADVETRRMLLDFVARLAANGSAIVYSTHYLSEVEDLGATVAVLEAGRIIAKGTRPELVARYGGSAVELTFDGPAPAFLEVPGSVATGKDSVLRLATENPSGTAAALLARLAGQHVALKSIDIVTPGLEAVYLALTGRRSVIAQVDGEGARRDAA